LTFATRQLEPLATSAKEATMYGLISQLVTFPEKRNELVQILAAGTKDMPGCLSYVIAKDASRDDTVWVTEVWTDSESHAASLKLPAVQEALTKGRPLIVGMGTRTATHPVAGI
jgi:quinol monooxygenase YgiN